MRNIYEYIAYGLLMPETAAGQTQRIMKEIRSFDEMPMRYRRYEEEPWHSRRIAEYGTDQVIAELLICTTSGE